MTNPKWSKIFPKYKERDKHKCLALYWEEYKTKSDELEKNIEVFKKFNTNDLNDTNKIIEMLEFCQINPTNIKKIHINKTSTPKKKDKND